MKFSVFKNKKPLDEPLENFEMLWTAPKEEIKSFSKENLSFNFKGKI